MPAMQETHVHSLGWEDPLEKDMATHSGILAWRIPMDRGAWWATVHGVTKSGTRLSRAQQQLAEYIHCPKTSSVLCLFILPCLPTHGNL